MARIPFDGAWPHQRRCRGGGGAAGQGSSLLPAGVRSIEGEFHSGDVVEVIGPDERLIGRGIVNYDSDQLRTAAGWSSDEVMKRMEVHRIEVIHRDEWVTLRS